VAFALMPITFRSSPSEAQKAQAVAPEMRAFEGTGHRNRRRPGSMASVVIPRNAMLAKNQALLAATHLFAVRNDCISPALAVRTYKSLIGDCDTRPPIEGPVSAYPSRCAYGFRTRFRASLTLKSSRTTGHEMAILSSCSLRICTVEGLYKRHGPLAPHRLAVLVRRPRLCGFPA
jgi:hypothetical protein